ncbi:MAG: hypothetical protein Q8P15_04155 [Nanoarchaeota archaeon]|nr:hypothetical protein [Nanoarchaeota archaeon]
MRRIFLFFGALIIFLFLINFVVAETCENVGDVENGMYCGTDGNFYELKNDGSSCLNDYECEVESCVEGICQSKYSSILENSNFLEDIWNSINGVECESGEESCDGKNYLMCGLEGVWENKGEVNGKCGFYLKGSLSIDIVISSPKNLTYDTSNVLLKVSDNSYLARYWSYSLNGGEKINFTEGTYINAKFGSNLLTIYAKETSSSSEEKKTVIFSVVNSPLNPSCGDKICSSNENCNTCSKDCGACEKSLSSAFCGDGVCSSTESSYTCSSDCKAVKPKNNWAIVVLIVAIIIALIILVVILLKKKLRKAQQNSK